MDIRRGRRAQIDSRPRDIGRVAPTSGRDTVKDRLAAVRIGPQSIGIVGYYIAGGDGVDVDALARPLIGQKLCQPYDPVLGCSVGLSLPI